MALPLQKTDLLPLSLLQTQWKAQLDPILANPMTNMVVLKNIDLIAGDNVINHTLGRIQQGWIITDQQKSGATIYRSAPFDSTTLTLTSSAEVTISLGVF